MTASSEPRARREGSGGEPAETALSWAAVAAAAGAVFAWAACCVLSMSLALAGLGLGGLSRVAGQRTWITLGALAVMGMIYETVVRVLVSFLEGTDRIR